MYSEKISEEFKKHGIEIGDRISIKDSEGSNEGMLMPRPDVSKSDIIIIKRDDGYNIGIKYGKGTKLKRVSGKQHAAPERRFTAKPQKGLPKVTLLYTGGTIGSKLDYVSGGVKALTKAEELLAEVPELGSIAELEVKQIMSVFSEDMTHMEWKEIAEAAAEAINNGSKGVIVTHGTDTMHYTASALSFMLHGLNAPVILTGAQRSSDRGSSDAFMNLICSAYAAGNSDIAEVVICMHADSSDKECMLIRGTKARKMHTSRRDAFRPVNNSAIAYVSINGSIRYNSAYRKTTSLKEKVAVKSSFEAKVALLNTHPNSSPEMLDFLISKGYRGIILEGTGLGQIPINTKHSGYNWRSALKRAIDAGMVVGMTSQCLYGRVNPRVYSTARELADLGVIYCEDMLPETAYVKLGFLLGNYGKEDAEKLLSKDLSGEITARSETEWKSDI